MAGNKWTDAERRIIDTAETIFLQRGEKEGLYKLKQLLPNKSAPAIDHATRIIRGHLYRTLKKEKEENEMNLDKVDTAKLLEEASRRGFIHSEREILVNRHYEFPKKLKPFKIGIVSDTHLGSQMQQITLLKEAYSAFKEEGIKQVFHAGDLVEGNGKLYKGQLYEMFIHGADKMLEYAEKVYPKVKGITTYVVGGSHDYCYFKDAGYDILKKLAERRNDIKYLGVSGAFINIGKIKIYVMHPGGGNTYARSYRMQKIIEQFPPKDKPNILLAGHLHITNELPSYRNVAGFQLPCFQTQTQYLREKGLNPDIGYLILEIFPDEKGIAHFKTDWHIHYVPLDGDF